jgi:hypothetical protein
MPIAELKIETALIDKLEEAFDKEVYQYDKNLLRQGDKLEKHKYKDGIIENGILQSHILNEKFPEFTELLLKITTHDVIKKVLDRYHGNDYKLIQTMIFHGNPLTSLHTDDIYLDSCPSGKLIGMLIAFEDFDEQTGGIGLYELTKEEIDHIYGEIKIPHFFSSAEEIYRIRGSFLRALEDYCKSRKCSSYFPKKGQVIYWDTWMPHFTIPPLSNGKFKSRFSCASHYIPSNAAFGTRLGGNSSQFAERFNATSIPL